MRTTILLVIVILTVMVGYYFMQKNTRAFSKNEHTIRGLGIIGDSQSDEYRADDDRGAEYADGTRNWVELLDQQRGINVGEWGVREMPRRTGYAYNWALSGATTDSMLTDGQHTGLANQIKNREVNVVVIYIGANDFAPYTPDGYPAIYNGTIHGNALSSKISQIEKNIATAVQTVQQAGDVEIFLLLIPDWGDHVAVQEAFPDEDKRKRVSDAIKQANDAYKKVGKDRDIEVVDPNDLFEDLLKHSDGPRVEIGGKKFDRQVPSINPTSIFLSDNVHLGTVVNGLFANFLIERINKKTGASIEKFSNEELFSIAGIK